MPCKNLLRKSLTAILLFIIQQSSFAQEKTISGQITDSKDKSPIANASVQVKGSSTGTTTGEDGKFRLTAGVGATTLVISSIGFENQEVNISNKSEISVSLISLTTGLGEVVVVGYGTQKKKEVTSAITTISAENMNKGNISDVAQLLQGKVSGLSISRPGGNPNGGFNIRLRGISTLGSGTQPLIVVDGFVGADLNTVDPSDIKSIDVLKDGSSAAIYGTRGSAGVIIITTTTGSKGSKLSYNTMLTTEKGTRFTDHMTADEFRKLKAETNIGNDYGANTDWIKKITRTAISHTHNLGLYGGTDNTSYGFTVNYRDVQGIAITTGFKQINTHAKLTHKALHDRLIFNVDATITNRESDNGFDVAFLYATTYNPTAPVYTKDPLYDITGAGYFQTGGIFYANPVAILEQNTNKGQLKRTNVNGTVEIELIKGLKFLTRYGVQSGTFNSSAYSPRNAFIDRGFPGGSGNSRKGIGANSNNLFKSQLYENTLNYTKSISNLEVKLLGGYSYQEFENSGTYIETGNFLTDLTHDDISTSQDITNGQTTLRSYKSGSKLVAFFGRLNLNYNNMAYLSASIRKEGSTQFGKNNKWGIFPAVSAGIDIDRIIDIPSVNSLKLRASYGVTGQLPPRQYLSLLTFKALGNFLIDGKWTPTYGPDQNSNPDFKWEKKAETDIGLDFVAFNSRLAGTADFYIRKTSDLIFNVEVPSPPALFNRAWKNVGELEAKGFEFALNYDVIKDLNKFSWNTGLNFYSNNVKLTYLDPSVGSNYIGATNLGTPGQEQTQITRTIAGKEIGSLWGTIYNGIDANGKYLFTDKDGKPTSSEDYKTVIGQGLPKFEAGWANTLKYGNIDLNFFFRGAFGHDIVNTYRAFYENPQVASVYNPVNTKYFNSKIKEGQKYSSLFVEKGDYIKLDNATLGYNFDLKNSKIGQHIKTLRAYISGYNLLLITDYTGVDPEIRYVDNQDTENPLGIGIDRRENWALTRSFTIGLKVGL